METRQVDILLPGPEPGEGQLGEAGYLALHPGAIGRGAAFHTAQDILRPAAPGIQIPVLHVGNRQQLPLAVPFAPAAGDLLTADEAIQRGGCEISGGDPLINGYTHDRSPYDLTARRETKQALMLYLP